MTTAHDRTADLLTTEQFADDAVLGAAQVQALYLGDRLGWYRVLTEEGPLAVPSDVPASAHHGISATDSRPASTVAGRCPRRGCRLWRGVVGNRPGAGVSGLRDRRLRRRPALKCFHDLQDPVAVLSAMLGAQPVQGTGGHGLR